MASENMALDRIRHLCAYEVGYTRVFPHKYSARSSGRESLVYYPPPLFDITHSGELDLSYAYAQHIGEHHNVSVRIRL